MKPKVLIIDNSIRKNGASESILKWIIAVQAQYEFHLVLPLKSELKQTFETHGCKVISLNMLELSKSLRVLNYPFRLKKNTVELIKYIVKHDIKLIHVNDIYNQLGVEIKKKLPNIQFIQHVRLKGNSYIKRLYPYFSKRIKRYADKIICVSESVKNDLNDCHKAIVIYDPIGLKEILPTYEVSHEVKTVVCLSRIMQGKGQHLVLEAFIRLIELGFKGRLIFVGLEEEETTFEKALKQRVFSKKLENQIIFKPFTQAVEEVMKSADLVVHFSMSESFSRVCLESLYYGVPMVVSDCGGPAEITNNGAFAELVPPGNVSSLVDAVQEIATSFERRKYFSSEGKAFVTRNFSEEFTIKRLNKVYLESLK